MKKSKSSVPRFADKFELDPEPAPRNDGLFATGGRPLPERASGAHLAGNRSREDERG
jgi:hypothetical protein